MIVLSLFDGMSCGQIALKEIGINVDTYYASEIDKYAIKQTQHNFPNTIQLGDVLNWRNWVIDWKSINLILAGSPCQGFSFAGKQLAFDDPRSKLFFVFIDIFNHVKKLNPNVKFLLENVDMKRKHMKVISDYCGVFPVNINSNLVSAQNRNRWYWTNIRTKQIGLFDEIHSDIPQPKDKGILLRDILDKKVNKKYYIDNIKIELDNIDFINDNSLDVICVAMRGRYIDDLNNTEQKLEPNLKCKTNCITSVTKDNLIFQINNSKESGGKQPYQQNRVYADFGIIPALTAELGGRNNIYNNSLIRRLTPTECAKLQTIPNWYEWVVSETQIYRMLGNGWTVDVIKHIFSFL